MKIQAYKPQIANELKTTPTPVPVIPLQPSEIVRAAFDSGGLESVLNETVKKALSLSYLVYMPLDHAAAELRAAGYEHVQPVSVWFTDTQFICCTKDGYAYIAYRGSESLMDWLIDFSCIPCFWPLRHLGFELAWRSVRGKVRAWLKQVSVSGQKVILCGHSLGGGIAHLSAFNLAKDYNIANVVTFGAPKVSFLGTAKKYNETQINNDEKTKLGDVTYCVVNQRDIVAKVPFSLLGFRDIGHLIYIDQKLRVRSGDKAREIRGEESMADIDFLINFFGEERQVAMTGVQSVDGAVKVAKPELSGWDAFYDFLQKAMRETVKAAPVLKVAIIPPVLYLLFTFYFMRSGLSHLTGKYIGVFFKEPLDLGFKEFKPSKLKIIISTIIRGVLGLAVLSVLAMGLYYTTMWSFRAFLEKNPPPQPVRTFDVPH